MNSTPFYAFVIRARILALALACLALLGGYAMAAESEQKDRKTTQSESYIPFEPFYASILIGGRAQGLLLVEFGLDVPDVKLRNLITRASPVLRDAYVRSIVSYASTAVRPWRQPSVEDIANRLQAATDTMTGKKGARVLMAQTAIRLTQ